MPGSRRQPSFESASLREAAEIFAKEVMTDFEEERWRHLPLHAGAAAEFLGKAALARTSPLLLADGPGNVGQTLVKLSKSSGADDDSVRTVGLGEAVRRLSVLEPDVVIVEKDHKMLTAARNAAVHLGAGTSQALPLLLAFVRVCNALLPATGTNPRAFWGRSRTAAAIAQRARANERADTEIRLALAKARAGDKSESSLRSARADVASHAPLRDNEEHHACPVCECTARFVGTHDWQGGDVLLFTPAEVRCEGCMLKLASTAALKLAGAQDSWTSVRPPVEIQQLFGHRK